MVGGEGVETMEAKMEGHKGWCLWGYKENFWAGWEREAGGGEEDIREMGRAGGLGPACQGVAC